MNKVRVYEVARELGMNNRELLGRIQSLGIQVRNHMSALEPAEVDRVRRALDKDKADNTVEERINRTVIRRRTKKSPDGSDFADVATGPAEPAPSVLRAAPEPRPEPRPEPLRQAPVREVASAPEPVREAPVREAALAEPVREAPVREAALAEPVREVPVRDAMRVVEAPVSVPAPEPVHAVASAPVERPPVRAEAAPASEPRAATPSQPPPAAERFAHANLPPGVIVRGNQTAPSVGQISEQTKTRIIQQHAQQRGRPRRVEVGRQQLGQPGRPATGRAGRRKLSPNKKGMKTEITVPSAQKRLIKIEGDVALSQLAQRMSLKATDLLMKLMQMGELGVTINSTLDTDTAKLIASEFGYEVENVAKSEDDLITEMRGTFEDREEARETRAPIVTVMGHVDHGKTSLLDRIRSANVASGEAGGITQHIGAYRVETPKGPIAFIDTPGHEAFTEMRARGAQATDVVVLVVAADDGVMPQTKEAISHAKAAEVPIIVAVNKIDKPDAVPDRIRQELSGYGLQPEEWGGETLFVNVSALTGQGVDELLECIALQAEILELTANSSIPAEGVVLEAKLDRGRGAVANVLIRNGTLRQGDTVVAGAAMGKVRALTDEHGRRVKEAGPSTPVEILGLGDVPNAGDGMYVVEDEERARDLVAQRQVDASSKAKRKMKTGLEAFQESMLKGESETLNLVIKGDVHGSVEALHKALSDLSTDKVRVNVIHTGVGGITEQDVMLVSASTGLIIGFNVRPVGKAGAIAKSEGVDIRSYRVIYEAVDDVKKAMVGLLAPEQREKDVGKAEVRETFGIPKIGTIAGCYVTDGKLLRNGKIRLVRDGVVVWEGDIVSLRRFKEDVREVAQGFECGVGLQNFNDVKTGDVLECFVMEEVEASL
ncbi:MAG: translation initiation factor IF-2 [Sandaracinaceae bacterium]|nr:translation initiation factor IF-2 [Sandaracinaceae bacterium]